MDQTLHSEGKDLKKTRRIEITAFRRRVTIYSGDARPPGASDPWPPGVESSLNVGVDNQLTICLNERCDTSLDTARAGELASLAAAVIESEGKTSGAAHRFGLRCSTFYAKLRSLGLPFKRLRNKLNVLQFRRDRSNVTEEAEPCRQDSIEGDSRP